MHKSSSTNHYQIRECGKGTGYGVIVFSTRNQKEAKAELQRLTLAIRNS
jgi:hypothetical protein